MKVVVFTEAGKKYGYGHLMRCLAVAQGFEAHNIEVKFLIRGEGYFNNVLGNIDFEITDWLNADFVENYLNKFDVAIVDSYFVSVELSEVFLAAFKKIIFFDDYNRIPYPGGIVLNGVIGAEKINYSKNKNVKYLLGAKFQPLRKDFWEVDNFIVKENIEEILITFGGSDVANKTPEYLQKIIKYYPNADKKVIIGAGFSNLEKIKMVSDTKTHLIFNPDSFELIKLMQKSDFAVASAGQTLSELARIGVPTIGIKVADNQKNNIINWSKSGFLIDNEFIEKGISKTQRCESSSIGQNIIDGKGVLRVVEEICCT